MTQNKYHAIKTAVGDITFDSRREASRYHELLLLQRGGVIRDLEMQVPYPVVVNGKKICKYIADFRYFDVERNKLRIEDSKGVRTQVYRIKKKLVEALYSIKIEEV